MENSPIDVFSNVPVASPIRVALAIAFLTVSSFWGCQPPHRDLHPSAEALNAQGIAAKDSAQARALFQEAINTNRYYEPAFNNLGVSYLQDGDFYRAATAFDQAIKLQPLDPVPRLYLGLVYEHAGQLQNALDQYNHALELAPQNIEVLQALTRVRVKLDDFGDQTMASLQTIASRGTDGTCAFGPSSF